MKKAIVAALLFGSAATTFAQDNMRGAALQMQAGQEFAEKLVQNALTIGKTGDITLTDNGAQGWDCHVRIRNGATATLANERADSPERACVKAVLVLNKHKAL